MIELAFFGIVHVSNTNELPYVSIFSNSIIFVANYLALSDKFEKNKYR